MNNRKKYRNMILLLLSLLIVSIVLIILLSMFGFKRIVKSILGLNYTMVTSVTSIIAIIVTIILNQKDKNKTLEANIRAQSQIEFKQKLYDVLSLYDQLLSDVSLLRLDFNDNNSPDLSLISEKSITNQNNCIYKYQFLLNDMEFKIFYYHNYRNCEHNELDKLLRDIQGLNQALILELDHYADLSSDIRSINSKYINYKKELRRSIYYFPFDFSDYEKVVRKTNDIIKNIGNLISNKKLILYEEALKCIEEREIIMKNK